MTDKKDYQDGKRDQNDSSAERRTDKVGSGRTIGRGMDSPDSTEAVLDASTGEPDPRARGEGMLPPGSQSDQQSGQSNKNQSNKNRSTNDQSNNKN
ncbi:MAG: hypothetical protein ACR2M1_09450 [Gemmatimonadaceae bacterium]